MSDVFLFILLALASFRITRIITTDHWPVSRWFRYNVKKRFGEESSWFDLVTCNWCIGTWITIAVFAWADYLIGLPFPALQAVAAMTLAGMIGNYD